MTQNIRGGPFTRKFCENSANGGLARPAVGPYQCVFVSLVIDRVGEADRLVVQLHTGVCRFHTDSPRAPLIRSFSPGGGERGRRPVEAESSRPHRSTWAPVPPSRGQRARPPRLPECPVPPLTGSQDLFLGTETRRCPRACCLLLRTLRATMRFADAEASSIVPVARPGCGCQTSA